MPEVAALKKMSKYLLNGARMLQISCPTCEIPLIQEKNSTKIFCVNCLREAKFASNDSEAKEIEETISTTLSAKNIVVELNSVLLGKLNFLTYQIAAETDLTRLNAMLEVINKLLTTLKAMKDITK